MYWKDSNGRITDGWLDGNKIENKETLPGDVASSPGGRWREIQSEAVPVGNETDGQIFKYIRERIDGTLRLIN